MVCGNFNFICLLKHNQSFFNKNLIKISRILNFCEYAKNSSQHDINTNIIVRINL